MRRVGLERCWNWSKRRHDGSTHQLHWIWEIMIFCSLAQQDFAIRRHVNDFWLHHHAMLALAWFVGGTLKSPIQYFFTSTTAQNISCPFTGAISTNFPSGIGFLDRSVLVMKSLSYSRIQILISEFASYTKKHTRLCRTSSTSQEVLLEVLRVVEQVGRLCSRPFGVWQTASTERLKQSIQSILVYVRHLEQLIE